MGKVTFTESDTEQLAGNTIDEINGVDFQVVWAGVANASAVVMQIVVKPDHTDTKFPVADAYVAIGETDNDGQVRQQMMCRAKGQIYVKMIGGTISGSGVEVVVS